MARTSQQRLDAIPDVIHRRDEFLIRVKEAETDAVRCADLMTKAIDMLYEANSLEPVDKNGKAVVSIEKVCAAHCMFAARDAYRRARGSNQANVLPTANEE